MFRIVCVNAGNYEGRGKEYVEILYDSVIRHFPDGVLHKFTCFTDDLEPYHEDIQKRSLEGSLTGWWNKLYLFQHGLFDDGDIILYFDLDTCITGPLDDLVGYAGEFAMLRDVYRPDGLQSSVMIWKANNRTTDIWNLWIEAEKPRVDGGDQAWIEKCNLNPDLLQPLYPDFFASYRLHAMHEIPLHASVVFFHAHPRPHEVTDSWVPHVWKIGGHLVRTWRVVGNVSEKVLEENVISALERPCELLADQYMTPTEKTLLIVGGGPSLKDDLVDIAFMKQYSIIWALNGAFKYLIDNGIQPDGHIILDARQENIEFVPDATEAALLYSAQCHPDVLDKGTKAGRLILWIPAIPSVLDILRQKEKRAAIVSGGSSVGIKAFVLAQAFGFKNIHLFGYDSSYREDENHAYPQTLNGGERIVDITVNDQKFRCAPWMATQVEEFKHSLPNFLNKGMIFSVHGSGLLPYVATLLCQ